ncbi:hypothetical protein [Paraburkholderia sp. HP33-1]|uniref:hypothetical protein n=1 Tax=Paraburkholderia sp. HP33-1 TaxID=2883243 RepID=UPI001F37F9A6|nr:hypothetical protein [Paraburkholderia sp. HP33-1]
MGMLRDLPHITKFHHFWGSHKNRIKPILKRLSWHVLLWLVTLGYASAEEPVACPIVSPAMGVFSSDKIYRDSIVAIEKNDEDKTINLSLYRPDGNGCKRMVFAKYPKEGGAPNVDSIFFLKVKGSQNIFTIVHWDVNSRGIGTYGKYYQIYSYIDDGRGGLMENEDVVNNSAMTGMDGYQEGEQTFFSYKNAGAVKSFFKCNRARCN